MELRDGSPPRILIGHDLSANRDVLWIILEVDGTRELIMTDDTEIGWHKEQIAKNRAILEELEAGNTAGGDVFPETQSEIEHLKAQIAQSELIVAASEKQSSGDS
jgi:hypothetical protein